MQGISLLRLLCFSLLYGFCLTAKCHFPDGREATSHVQCQDGPDSACCGKDAICLTNGLCLDVVQPFGLSRASCTDIGFSIPECANVCTDINTSNGCSLILYNSTDTKTEYCCNSIVNNPNGPLPICDQNASTVTLDSATIMAGHAKLKDFKKADGNRDVAIGTGVGIPLGVIAILAIAWAVLERKSRFKMFRSPAGAGIAGNPYVANHPAAGMNAGPPVVYPYTPVPVEKPADHTYNNNNQPVELEERSHGGFGR